MFSMISTYFWGDDDDQVVPNEEQIDDSVADIDSDWILVNVTDKPGKVTESTPYTPDGESWCITPPCCFHVGENITLEETTDLENLLIEHPSMSVYGPLATASETSEEAESAEAVPTEGEESSQPVVRRQGRNATRVQQQLKVLEHSKQLANERRTKITTRNRASKIQNLAHFQHGKRSKRNKRMDRKDGKHVGLHGKRGS